MIYKFFAASKPPTNVLNLTNLKRQVEDSHKQLKIQEGTYHRYLYILTILTL